MPHFYTILCLPIINTSIFAMDKKDANWRPSNLKIPLSCSMEPEFWVAQELWGYDKEKDNRTEHTNYKYQDENKSSYTTYNDSLDKKKN